MPVPACSAELGFDFKEDLVKARSLRGNPGADCMRDECVADGVAVSVQHISYCLWLVDALAASPWVDFHP